MSSLGQPSIFSLMQRRQAPRKEPQEFEEEVIEIARVTRVVKGGRRLRFRATVVIGDKKGRVGMGIGKSVEVQKAIKKAVTQAKKELFRIPLNKTTIPHEVLIKFKSSRVMMRPASPGTGIIAGGPARKVIELSGIKDVLSKSFGSNNPVNCTKAALTALKRLRALPQKPVVAKPAPTPVTK